MDATFISIHDLTPDARILYSSDSVIDILGYTPDELVNRSCWDFFPFEELPYAQKFHERRVTMDKAAVLAYCNVKSKDGGFVACECCFTIVYDVMVVCTSVYRQGGRSEDRALAAPLVRRLFTSSPKDPRYHMLSHLSNKFEKPAKIEAHEPRAALFLNRFTRTLSIMYATTGIQDIIGIPAEVMRGRSFYYCIAESCLKDAVKCLENAKGNDSIAYLRFWFRDPRADDPSTADAVADDSDEEMTTDASEDGGVQVQSSSNSHTTVATTTTTNTSSSITSETHGHESHISSDTALNTAAMDLDPPGHQSESNSRSSSDDSTRPKDTHEAIFGNPNAAKSSTSSLAAESPSRDRSNSDRHFADPIELEAVISCASDGLVVCLRKARPMIPHPANRPSKPVYPKGMFAAPWAQEPILPPIEAQARAGFSNAFAPSLGPLAARRDSVSAQRAHGPDTLDFMAAVRDQAIFAWALTGINGALVDFGHGKPAAGAFPESGLPIWANDSHYTAFPGAADDKSRGHHQNGSGGMSNGQPPDLGPNATDRASTHIFQDSKLAQMRDGFKGNPSNGHGINVPPPK